MTSPRPAATTLAKTLATALSVMSMAAIILAGVAATPSRAQRPTSEPTTTVTQTVIGDEFLGGSRLDPTSGSGATTTSPPPDIFDVDLGTDALNGDDCWQIVSDGTMSLSDAQDMLASFDSNGVLYDACPSIADIVAGSWSSGQVPPPPPTPLSIAPGYAVTGMQAFLVIGGANPVSLTVPVVGETVVATARYVVRWGDGTTTATDSQGLAYPGGPGQITHVYRDSAQRTVTVEAYWTGVWSGQNLGELPVPTTGEFPLDVREVQAIRQR